MFEIEKYIEGTRKYLENLQKYEIIQSHNDPIQAQCLQAIKDIGEWEFFQSIQRGKSKFTPDEQKRVETLKTLWESYQSKKLPYMLPPSEFDRNVVNYVDIQHNNYKAIDALKVYNTLNKKYPQWLNNMIIGRFCKQLIANHLQIQVSENRFEEIYYMWYGGNDAVDNPAACLINDHHGDYLERTSDSEITF